MVSKPASPSRLRRAIAATVLVTLAAALSGCGSFNTPSFEPGDLFDFLDTKKRLPGDRRAVFPEGVPGLEQGVPKDLYKGAQASTTNQQPIEPPPAAAPPPKQKRSASRTQRQPAPQPAPDPDAATASDEEGTAAAPPAPPPKRRAAQRQQQPAAARPAPADEPPSAFPAPLPSGSFAR